MEKDEMKKLFEKFKEEAFKDLPTEEAKEKAVAAFIFGFSKL